MKFKIAGVVVIAVMLCAMAAEYGKRSKPQEAVVVTDTYVVMAGDTLWNIADEFCPDGEDKRKYIDDLRVRNRLAGSVIHAGQEIEIWRYEK